jgi:hypothetical protein
VLTDETTIGHHVTSVYCGRDHTVAHVLLALALLTVVSSADVTAATVPEALSAPVCVACQVDGDRIRDEYSSDDWNTLTAGKVLTSDVTDGGPGANKEGTVQAAGIILRPPSHVWTTLVDFASRPQFQPGTKDVRVVRVDGNRVWVTEHLRFFLVDVGYTVINTLDPARPGTRRCSRTAPGSTPAGTCRRSSSSSCSNAHCRT